jgi:hypothetical protein
LFILDDQQAWLPYTFDSQRSVFFHKRVKRENIYIQNIVQNVRFFKLSKVLIENKRIKSFKMKFFLQFNAQVKNCNARKRSKYFDIVF